ncbi:DHA2 family efflux MFS transporter permease subunit [Geothrix fermentans]|uniref:DHA2 family efflux MFS transporter permease subunit n=1 Tax=Geothrix fermentans TaxID=44676 RepID=UPI00041E0388|nr:DHA2 family efflux MFS transporter permease subunit [Geothrix fermentans]
MDAPRGTAHKWIVALTTMLGTFMEVLDTSVANVALPHMKGTFAAGTDEITWVITSYLVANAIILPITGWLGATFGRKRLYLLCLAIFTLASFGAGAAPSLAWLILMRVVQGLAGGAMVPMSQAITLEAFPQEEHGMASALFGIGVIFGPILGPLVGGWVTDNWTWPWIFWINIPVGVLAYYLAFVFVEDPDYLTRPEGAVDYWSLIFVAVGLGCLELFLSRGERLDWFASNAMKACAGLAALGIALFIWRSLTAENPLVDLRLFRLPEFAGGMAIIFIISVGLYAAFILVPLFVQNLLGFTPTWAGLILSPGGVASVVAMIAVGLAMGKVDVRLIVAAGAASMAYSAWLLTHVNLQTGMAYLVTAWIFHGLGLGFVFVPIATAAVQRIPPALVGTASGLFNLMRNEGGSVGIALASTLLAQRAQFHHTRLAEHITPFSGPLQAGYASLTQGLFPRAGLDPVSVRGLAQGLIGAEVTRQSFLMSFVDVFGFLVVVFLLALPFVLTLRNPRGGDLSLH